VIAVGSRWRPRFAGFELTVVATFGGIGDTVKAQFDRESRTRLFSTCDLRRGFVEI
jgi:hypothetical protein